VDFPLKNNAFLIEVCLKVITSHNKEFGIGYYRTVWVATVQK
jgi:hypothetical protein